MGHTAEEDVTKAEALVPVGLELNPGCLSLEITGVSPGPLKYIRSLVDKRCASDLPMCVFLAGGPKDRRHVYRAANNPKMRLRVLQLPNGNRLHVCVNDSAVATKVAAGFRR